MSSVLRMPQNFTLTITHPRLLHLFVVRTRFPAHASLKVTKSTGQHADDLITLPSTSPASLISKVTDVVNEEVEQWRDRLLEAVYPVVWLDGLVVKVHQDHQVLNKTIYLALAINMEGYKELLGIWISEHEGASFWAQVLTELSNRGVKDVFVFCVDGLTGFPEAIKGVFPKSDIQLCIVHLVRNSLKYVSWKYRKELARDLKEIYHA